MAAGKHTLRSGKLHRPRGTRERFRGVIRPGDRFDATEAELKAFGDLIITYEGYLALVSDAVEEVEGDTPVPPTAKPKAKRKSRAKKAAKPAEEESSDDPEPPAEEPLE